jgi:S-adenosylmethionine:tRNA ribosyltransferase-isomerase
MSAPFSFTLPAELSAKEPAERRGIARDEVRLMVSVKRSPQSRYPLLGSAALATQGVGNPLTERVEHTKFNRLGEYLRPGDLLVFNSSRTLPAALNGCESPMGLCLEVRLAQHLPDDSWLALLLCQQGEPFACGLRDRIKIDFGQGLTATVENRDSNIPRLWKLRFSKSGSELMDALYRLGRPIRYEYVCVPWDLDYYQTVYAKEPGSAEMPSAGRAFTWKLLFDLKRRGIQTAHIVLHTSLSSYMDDELDLSHPASEEEYFISEAAAEKINQTKEVGGRIIAVGTTVVRALESVADETGKVHPQHGYTRLHITANHQLKVVNGLLTGMHEPEASHLDLLTAFLPAREIWEAYEEAVQQGYLWHEFGDLHLIA